MEIVSFEPILKPKIWGGNRIKTMFSSQTFINKKVEYVENVGEMLVLSALENEKTVVNEGVFKGFTLDELWYHKPGLFGNHNYKKFPTLFKIIDAQDHLSVQLHPKIGNFSKVSKSECWYIIDCAEDADVVIGHTALGKEDFIKRIKQQQWDDLLIKKYIKPGDFIYVPSGTIHAIRAGTFILEISQSEDITYRVFDYNRVAANGTKREMHIEQAMNTVTIPHQENKLTYQMEWTDNLRIVTFLNNKEFFIEKWEHRKSSRIKVDWNFAAIYCIEGQGLINRKPIKEGQTYLLTFNKNDILMEGNFSFIISKY